MNVSRIGVGCVTFGRELDENASFRIMDEAASRGINLFDTAASYGTGASERIVGKWLRHNRYRNRVVLQSKVKPPFTRANIRKSLADTLARLQTERLDLYFLHEYDPSSSLLETMEALTELVESGRVLAVGCSNFTLSQMQAANAAGKAGGLHGFRAVQPPYNLLSREIECAQLDYCRQHAIAVITYSPLAAGFLTGKYSSADGVPAGTRFDIAPRHRDVYFSKKNFVTVEKLRRLASESGLPMHRLAMGWVLQNAAIASTLVGATAVAHIRNALEALQLPLDRHLIHVMDQWAGEHL